MTDAATVADTFAALLRRYLTPEQFEAVRWRNAAEDSPGVCHSHDFCDANMVMAEAMQRHGFDVESDQWAENDSALATWNAAWDDAKARHLTARGRG